MKIPNSVLYVVADVLGSWYYSKSKLDTLFGGCGFPGDAPAGNCVQKCQQWMRQANEDTETDPLQLLGCALVEFTSLDLHDDPRWETGFHRIRDALFKNGLVVERILDERAIASAPSDKAMESSDVERTGPANARQAQTGTANLKPLPATIIMKSTVLFLAANPDGVTRLALDQECRAIREKLRASEYPKALELRSEWAVRLDDLLQYLNEYRPHVVHFSGHGSTADELILHDEFDLPKPVNTPALRALFSSLKDNIRLVVLNACYSRPQAEAIVEIVDCAVGMKKAIGDRAAIVFAAWFQAGFGKSVQEAFDQGCTALMLEGLPEENTPDLLVKHGVDAGNVRLAGPDINPR